jgi:hypothetical protein
MSRTEPDDVRSRVVGLLAAAHGVDALEGALVRARAELPDDVEVRLGIRHEADPMALLMGERGASEPVDAVIEITLADGIDLAGCPQVLARAGAALGDAIDRDRSAAIAGTCYRFLHDGGAVFAAIAARRAPGTTMEQLTDWWLHEHGPLALRIVAPSPLAYEQLHGDAATSRAAADAAGIAGAAYDMYDTIGAPSIEELERAVSEPTVAAQLFEDEVGHVDHSSFRGAMQRTL